MNANEPGPPSVRVRRRPPWWDALLPVAFAGLVLTWWSTRIWQWIGFAIVIGSAAVWFVCALRQHRRLTAALQRLDAQRIAYGGWESMSIEQQQAWLTELEDVLQRQPSSAVQY